MAGLLQHFLFSSQEGWWILPNSKFERDNTDLVTPHFKMETFRTICQTLMKDDWVITIDLKDAYVHVPIFPGHRWLLRFHFQRRHYLFKAMTFKASNGLLGIHKDESRKIFKVPSGSYFHVFKWLDSQKSGSAHSQSTDIFDTEPLPRFGIIHKLSEILLDSITRDNVLGTSLQLGGGNNSSVRGEIPESCASDKSHSGD